MGESSAPSHQGLVRDAQLRHRTRRRDQKANTGHHHLLIDVPVPPLDQPIPNDRNHLHFGLGQTETVIELPPGKHTLQLLMGDADHVPHDPPVMSQAHHHLRARGASSAGTRAAIGRCLDFNRGRAPP